MSGKLTAGSGYPRASRICQSLLSMALGGTGALWLGWRLAILTAPAGFAVNAWSQPDRQAEAALVAGRHWFGVAQPVVPPPLQLSGVFAPKQPADGDGFAIVMAEGRLQYLIAGQGAVNGWVLEQVRDNGIVLRQGAQRQFYPLLATAAGPAFAPPAPPLPPSGDGQE